MDDQQLQEIEARANAAAPGPWTATQLHRESDYPHTNYFTEQREVCGNASDIGPVAVACEADFANANFIVHARTDVPALVAEVRRLTAALATARREGAEEMRERAVKACCAVEAESSRGSIGLERDAPYFDGRRFGAWRCADALRALPLDAPGGRS